MTDNNVLTRTCPLLLIIGDEISRIDELCVALRSTGWEVAVVGRAADIGTFAAQHAIALCLIYSARDAEFLIEGTQALRSSGTASAAAPIVAMGRSPLNIDPMPSELDSFNVEEATTDSIVHELERWRPVVLDPTRRIAEMFGPGPIGGMIERLARRLEPALAQLAQGAIDRSEAHRLAGLCGTLGFRQAHAAWLDLSIGDQSAVAEVRRTTRLVLAAIARGL